jgi:hypothetical protein
MRYGGTIMQDESGGIGGGIRPITEIIIIITITLVYSYSH